LEHLLRKYGPTIADVREHARGARERHERLQGAGVALDQVGARLADAERRQEEYVQALRGARREAAPRFAEELRRQLAALAMADARFEVQLSEREPGPGGGDAAEFLIAANPGVELGPLREIASGGELSRVMLALTTVANTDEQEEKEKQKGKGEGDGLRGPQATLVFDEVDAGIGGHTARAVGERLRQLAGARQVVCITHLPQIASLADRHFSVVKDTSAQTTRTEVLRLGQREVVAEIVRMLGAEDGDASARRHARELLKAA
jgi:DNA repair protein RecN (Recombination protein N)